MSEKRSAGGGSTDDLDLYNDMLRLEEMETLLEEIEEIKADNDADLPAEVQNRLNSLGLADPAELRSRVELIHSSLDTAE